MTTLTVKSGSTLMRWTVKNGKSKFMNERILEREYEFNVESYMQVYKCTCKKCDALLANFELVSTNKKRNEGLVFATVNIKDIVEFQGCKSEKECNRMVEEMLSEDTRLQISSLENRA
jgi:thiol-disulfide isomerase/thioredoxin